MAQENTLPRVRVSGGPAERGRAYGDAARRQVSASREGYERAFARSGMPWHEAVEHARRYADAISSAFPEAISEMEGIAAGGGLPFDDVLAMNCRTEIMWQLAQQGSSHLRGECTSFGLAPAATENGHTWVGQNWDWLVHATDSIVVLEVERDDAPNYLTLVEAGLLGKATLNAAGIGIAVNTLITDRDRDTRGVPFHVVLRMLADIEHVSDAVELLAGVRRASSGNYLVGAAGGAVLDIECEPGGVAEVHPIAPVRGRIAHTNHFVAATRGVDLAPLELGDTYVRLQRMRDHLDAHPVLSIGDVHQALSDHIDAPSAICCHPDPRSDPASQWTTVVGLVMDLEDRALHLSHGSPCRGRLAPYESDGFLAAGA